MITNENDPFTIGKANMMRDGKDVTVIACGLMVYEALQAADILAKEGISVRVINMHTIKPIDEAMIEKCVAETGVIVTAEEHQIAGGLGSAVAEVMARKCPAPIEFIGVNDSFGMTGSPQELLSHFELKDVNIVTAVKKALTRKK
jgi:transketolase